MSFVVRAVRKDDLDQLFHLAKQFNLLNLPGDRSSLTNKINLSELSFAGEAPKSKAEYLFVLEDMDAKVVMGSSLVMAKHGTDETPHSYFKILKRNHFSQDLGVGFIHQVLRFQLDSDGPTEIGGLLLDRVYRGRPEKLGKQISLARFLYIGMHRDRFEDRVLCELMPPLTDDNRSEFWEALGRRFTGLNYQEADILSQNHKEFIESLFPEEDIYLSLLDSKARTVLGRVGEQTKPAQHLLESIGFEYLEEVDPFDGGPHYGAKTAEILPIRLGKTLKVADFKDATFKNKGLMGTQRADFRATLVHYEIRDDQVAIPAREREILRVDLGENVFLSPFEFDRRKEQT